MTDQSRPVIDPTETCPACLAVSLSEDPDAPTYRGHECEQVDL